MVNPAVSRRPYFFIAGLVLAISMLALQSTVLAKSAHRAKRGAQAAKLDSDHDGLTNLREETRTRTNPHRADTDGDGLSDGTEAKVTHTDPRKADSDGDGSSDGVEVRAGTNPWDPTSFPGSSRPGSPASTPPVTTPPAGTTPPSGASGTPVAAVWQPPVAVQVRKPVTLDGSDSTGDGPLACTWTFQNSTGTTTYATRTGCMINFTFESTGVKYVELSVADATGETAESVQSFPVVKGSTTEPPPTEPPPTEPPPSEPPPTEPPPTEPPSTTAHCFAAPHVCGYPDPTNTGVPAGTTLSASGSISASTAGQTITGKDVTGTINVTANNVTIANTRVTLNSGSCGPTTTCGNYDIRIDEGVTGTVIRNVETRAAAGVTCEHDIRNTSASIVTISGSDLQACDSNIYGNASVSDTYGIGKLAISTDHVENVYFNDGTFTANHVTLLNPVGQTAVIFGNVGGGSGGACQNHLTVTNSLLAGGGFTLYPCGNGSSAGSSSTVITGNHFARCTAKAVDDGGGTTACQGGPDANGYYPHSGNYGIESYGFGGTWSGNVWDDNLARVCSDGSSTGCS